MEYFYFRFFNLNRKERREWAGTGYMYEYQLVMNPREHRSILDDKTKFHRKYEDLIKHKVYDRSDLKSDESKTAVLKKSSNKLVFKVFNGKCGANILFKRTDEFQTDNLYTFMLENGYDLVEEYIIQHQDFNRLSPSAVNTVRIFSQLDADDEVVILGCRLRISVDSNVDNMAAGNLAAPIDELTGIVSGPGLYSDITKDDEYVHPISNVRIEGFKIPFWEETIALVKTATKLHPQNRSIGWDFAMTEEGPDLIEGNHDWCKLVWQLPVKKGLKSILEQHLLEYKHRTNNGK